MEPKDPSKKNPFESIFFSFSMPASYHVTKKETAEQMIARLDADDAMIDAMTSYPTAERMLNELFKKDAE